MARSLAAGLQLAEPFPAWVRLVRDPTHVAEGSEWYAERPKLSEPAAVARGVSFLALEEVERFAVLLVDRRNRLIACSIVSPGTLTAALAHPREVFRAGIAVNPGAI